MLHVKKKSSPPSCSNPGSAPASSTLPSPRTPQRRTTTTTKTPQTPRRHPTKHLHSGEGVRRPYSYARMTPPPRRPSQETLKTTKRRSPPHPPTTSCDPRQPGEPKRPSKPDQTAGLAGERPLSHDRLPFALGTVGEDRRIGFSICPLHKSVFRSTITVQPLLLSFKISHAIFVDIVL